MTTTPVLESPRAGCAVRLATDVPGPRSRALADRRAAAIPRGLGASTPVFAARSSGATIEDVDGNVLLDFAGGIGVLNAGAGNPRVVAAAHQQIDTLIHSCNQVAMVEPYVRLAERLHEITPGRFAKKSLFLNSGAEAVENAVKIARAATGRPGVVALEHAFHGRTLLTMSLTGKYSPYKSGFGPFAGDVHRLPSPYALRPPFGADPARWAASAADELERRLSFEIDPASVAAVIVEPVQGEGGFIPLGGDYLRTIQETCRRHGIVFVVDEVQTGFGRTGRLFACEHYGIEPDLLVTAKSLGGGFPLAAVTGRAEIMDAVPPGGLGTTYGGSPVALVAALEVIDVMLRDDLPGRAAAIGRVVEERFHSWVERYPLVGEARGLGAMQAVELVRDRRTAEPATAECTLVLDEALRRGLIVLRCGAYGNVIRFLAPLVISDAELGEGLDILESAIETASATSPEGDSHAS